MLSVIKGSGTLDQAEKGERPDREDIATGWVERGAKSVPDVSWSDVRAVRAPTEAGA